MAAPPKILLLDDDQVFLDTYQEMLSRHLPSGPEVRTATSGARALALLESEPFSLLCIDLGLPKMDGLQVLAIARRKYPELRIIVLTGLPDEQFRARAYAMGVDQYWLKPESSDELGLFMESIDSLLNRETNGGFRGVQSKSLVDIIQLECMSRNSTVLKITNGQAEARIWIAEGEIIDAAIDDLRGEAAFQRILAWRAGSFELLPPDAQRDRTIFTSYQGLLLNSAQAIDEAAHLPAEPRAEPKVAARLAEMAQVEGLEFVLAVSGEKNQPPVVWGLENATPIAAWSAETLDRLVALGDRLQAGQFLQIVGAAARCQVAMVPKGDLNLCIGFSPATPAEDLRDTMKRLLAKWDF